MNAKSLLLHSFLPCLLTFALPACSSDDASSAAAATGGAAGEAATGGASTGGKGTGGAASGGSDNAGGVGNEAGMGGEDAGTGGADNAFHGKVVDPSGRGVKDAKVVLAGHSYTTDADGAFEAKDVGDTYDLVVGHEGLTKTVHIWKGATTRSPVAIIPIVYAVPTVQVSGTLTGGAGFPNAAGTVTMVGFDCNDGHRVPAQVVTSASFKLNVSWAKWGPAKCRLLALEGKGDQYNLDSYTAYASREISLKDDQGTLSAQDLELKPVTTTTNVAVRHDYSTSPDTMSINFGPFPAQYKFYFSNSDVRMWTATVPDPSVAVWASLTTNDHKLSRRATSSDFGLVLLDWQQGIWTLAPYGDASIAPDGEFSANVDKFHPGMYEFDYTLSSGERLFVHTTEAKFTLPDLSALNVELAGKTTWSGTYSNNAMSVDTLLTSDPLPVFSNTTLETSFVFEANAQP